MIKSIGMTLVLATSLTVSAKTTFLPKIVGGQNAVQGEFPYIVSLRSGSFGHFCGGSLIRSNWVLTASHCVQGSSPIKVVVGLHDRTDKTGTETFTTKRIIAHPQYNANTTDYDYALIELNGDSTFRTIELNRIEIDIPNLTSQNPYMVWTSGWGTTTEGSYSLPKILNKVEVPLVSTAECNASSAYNNAITDRMICAGYAKGGKDSCQGDSGGPLFTKNTNGDFTLVGVVSWGQGCARPNKFGVYSKVNVMMDWINQQIQ